MDIQLKPADIFLTRGNSLLSIAIRFFSTSIGESRAKVNHVGVIVDEGSFKDCIVVEALSKVKEHKLWIQYGPRKKDLVAVYRPINLSDAEILEIVKYARKQVGRKYGYWKIVTHLLDWFLLGAYLFRRLTQDGNYPICSWLVAHAYSKVNKFFGCDPGAAQPDDIWDFVTSNPNKYQMIYNLNSIWNVQNLTYQMQKGSGIKSTP